MLEAFCARSHTERSLPGTRLWGTFLVCSGWGHPLEIYQEFALVASGREGAVCDRDPTNRTVGIPLVWVAFGVSGEASGALRGGGI